MKVMPKFFISYSHIDSDPKSRYSEGVAALRAAVRIYTHDVFISAGGGGGKSASHVAKLLRAADFAPRVYVRLDNQDTRVTGRALRAFGQSASCAVLVDTVDGASPLADEELREAIRKRFEQSRGRFRPIPIVFGTSNLSRSRQLLSNELPGVECRPPVLFDESVDERESLRRLILGIRGLDSEPREEWQHGWLRRAVRLRAANALSVAWDKLAVDTSLPPFANYDAPVVLDFGTSTSVAAAVGAPEDAPRHYLTWSPLPEHDVGKMPSDGPNSVLFDGRLIVTSRQNPRASGWDAWLPPDDSKPGVSGRLFQSLKRYVGVLVHRMGISTTRRPRQSLLLGAGASKSFLPWKISFADSFLIPKPWMEDAPTLLFMHSCESQRVSDVLGLKRRRHARDHVGVCFLDGLDNLLPRTESTIQRPTIMARQCMAAFAEHYATPDTFPVSEGHVPRSDARGQFYKPASLKDDSHAPAEVTRDDLWTLSVHLSQMRARESLRELALRCQYDQTDLDGWRASARQPLVCVFDGLDESGLGAVADRLGCVLVPPLDASRRGVDEMNLWQFRQHLGASPPEIFVYVWHAPTGAVPDEHVRLWSFADAREEEQTRERGDPEDSSGDEGLMLRLPLGDFLMYTLRPPV